MASGIRRRKLPSSISRAARSCTCLPVGRLVVITPACGYVDPTGAIVIGVAAGIVPFFACTKLKSWFGYDDALDTFGIHAVGGTLGAFLTGIFATASVNPNLSLSTAGSLNPATQNGLSGIVGHALLIEP